MRAAGLPVTVTVTGQPRDLPAVTDLSAFRIIQEALTNTLRHAGPATAAVTVHYAADALCIEVTDTGRGLGGPAAPGSHGAGNGAGRAAGGEAGIHPGHGLRGMRERAAVAGGTVEIGPRPRAAFWSRPGCRLTTYRPPPGRPGPPLEAGG